MVAPLVGAWIEINVHDVRVGISCLSLLSWERGLKFHCCRLCICRLCVAPLVGAWIEIIKALISCKWFFVAPLVGAWIEIFLLEEK